MSSRRGSAFNSAPCSPMLIPQRSHSGSVSVPLGRRRSSSMCLVGGTQPLVPVTPSASVGLGFLSWSNYALNASLSNPALDAPPQSQPQDKTSASWLSGHAHSRRASASADLTSRGNPAPPSRTRAKRSHSATMRGNVITGLSNVFDGVDADGAADEKESESAGAQDLIRLPARLPLPHRLISANDMEAAFKPQPLLAGEAPLSAPSSPDEPVDAGQRAKRRRSIIFAANTFAQSSGTVARDRRRPAQLDLSPHSSFTTLFGMQDKKPNSATSADTSPMRTRSRRPQSARGFAQPFFTTAGDGAAASPSSGLADAFSNALRGLRSPTSPRPFADSAGLSGASACSSAFASTPSSESPTNSKRDPKRRYSFSMDLSGARRRFSASRRRDEEGDDDIQLSPSSKCKADQQQQQFGSKSHAILGMNPSNANLLVPGGLGTGEEVYHGVVIDCPSIRLGSDDEDEAAPRASKEKTVRKKAAQWFKRSLVA